MRKGICILGIFILSLCISGLSMAAGRNGDDPEWTLIYYLAADNDQEAYADNTINQLLEATARVENHPQILVLIDRFSVPGTEIFTVDNGEILSLASYPEENTADSAVLQDFAAYALGFAENRNVAFVVKSEGLAWRGIGRDNTHEEDAEDQLMTNTALAEALITAQTVTGREVDLLVLEGSIMAFMEAVYDLREAAPLLVAPQSQIQIDGIPWDAVINELGIKPSMTGKELGITIVDSHVEYYATKGNQGDGGVDTFTNFAAMTVFDLSMVDDALAAHDVWAETSWLLFDDIYTYMAHARDLSAVGGLSYVTSVDFQHDIVTHMVECLRLLEEDGLSFPALTDAVDGYLAVHDKLVVYERSSESGDQLGATTGLGIWFPPTWLQYDTSDLVDDPFGSDFSYEDPELELNWVADSNWLTFLYEYFDRADATLEGNGAEEDEPPKKGVYDKMD